MTNMREIKISCPHEYSGYLNITGVIFSMGVGIPSGFALMYNIATQARGEKNLLCKKWSWKNRKNLGRVNVSIIIKKWHFSLTGLGI